MNRNLFVCSGFALALCALVGAPAVATDRDALAIAAASITSDELKDHVDVLADDTFEGRETGSRGGRAAGNYVYKEFEQLGAAAGRRGRRLFSNVQRRVAKYSGPGGRERSAAQAAGDCRRRALRPCRLRPPDNSYGPLGYIHNGADDNASGVAGLLEVLDAVKQLPAAAAIDPVRLLGSEEGGLIGSRHWVSRPDDSAVAESPLRSIWT